MKTKTHAKTLKMVQIALLAAIVVILQLFFSAVRVGPVTLNFVLVPIVIASVFIGPLAGFCVGAFAGVTTFIQVFTSADPFYIFLMTNNPVATAVICILKTALAGLLAGFVYNGIKKLSGGKSRSLGAIVPAVVCPVVNTGLFCLGMYLFFGNAFLNDAAYASVVAGNLFYFIVIILVGWNFVIELLLNVILCPLLTEALLATRFFGNKN